MRSPLPTKPLDAIGARIDSMARRERRRHALIFACAGAAIFLGALAIHSSATRSGQLQGSLEADSAVADARRAMALWTPQRGYAPMMGRSFFSASSWGATERVEALDRGLGISVDYAFASQAQCQGLVSNAGPFFDAIMVDGRSALDASGAPDPSACSAMGQNAIRLAKIDRRADESLSAGSVDEQRGGLVPQAALPAPSSALSAPTPPNR